MTLTGEEKKKYQREYMKKKRSNITDGSNISIESNITDGSNIKVEGLTYPDILYKLTDKVKWRPALEKICHAFKCSHHPDYAHDVMVGVYGVDIATACELLEVTG